MYVLYHVYTMCRLGVHCDTPILYYVVAYCIRIHVSICSILYMFHPLHHTAVIPPPQLNVFARLGSVARFVVGAATAERSERYISSLERADLGVPLEVEFEETQSSGAVNNIIDRNVSAPGADYNVQIWSINGASFSHDPVSATTTLRFDTGRELPTRHTYCM